MKFDRGILYVATGKRFLELALLSLQQLRKVEPEVKVAIHTDKASEDLSKKHFDYVSILRNPSFTYDDKIQGLIETPFKQTIYLDADTLPIAPFSNELFKALEYYPLLARGGMGFNLPWETEEYPDCLTQYNTGVIVYEVEQCSNFLSAWQAKRKIHPESHDQPTFRASILDHKVPVGELSAAYNFLDSNLITGKVKIIHCVSFKKAMTDETERIKLIEKVSSIYPPALVHKNIAVFNNKKFNPLGLFQILVFYGQKKIQNLRKRIMYILFSGR